MSGQGFRRVIHEIGFDTGTSIKLVPIGDIHMGGRGFNRDMLLRDIQEIKDDPTAYWIFMGDGPDAIGPRDRRWQVDMLSPDYQAAISDPHGGIFRHYVNDFCETFDPIMPKCLAMIDGNHERSVAYQNDFHFNSAIADHFGCSDILLGYWGRIILKFKRFSSKANGCTHRMVIDAGHGWQAGRSLGAKVNRLAVEMAYSDADIVLRGHSHESVEMRLAAWKSGKGEVKDIPWPRIGMHTGTYSQGGYNGDKGTPHVGYEELKMLGPGTARGLGSHRIIVYPSSGGQAGQQSFDYEIIKRA